MCLTPLDWVALGPSRCQARGAVFCGAGVTNQCRGTDIYRDSNSGTAATRCDAARPGWGRSTFVLKTGRCGIVRESLGNPYGVETEHHRSRKLLNDVEMRKLIQFRGKGIVLQGSAGMGGWHDCVVLPSYTTSVL